MAPSGPFPAGRGARLDTAHRRQARPATGRLRHGGPLGGLILTVLFTAVPLGGDRSLTLYGAVDNVGYSSDAWELPATVCVAPIAAWGPVTIALAIAYYRRRTGRPANTAVRHGTSPSADPPGAQRRPGAGNAPRS
ncbi:hypothetical protein [Streptomyces parvus]|uniref:hypothetical protein n=1 Tax=Streptomyces parvus TaxID=66428 RepID=UPI001EF22AB5|nr:hypothetical protein [Streptomyces parvus]